MPTKYELVSFYSQNSCIFSSFYSFAILREQIGSSRIKSDETGSIISILSSEPIEKFNSNFIGINILKIELKRCL